jgi:tetraacyldisaccharide 4'-kinase
MRGRDKIERLWRLRLAPLEWPLWAMLTPLAALYGAASELRSRWWEHFAAHSPITTISVGNLTVGGNGKTPFTLFLAKALRERGYRIGIVSRGYGRRSESRPATLVADGGRILLDARDVGDEPAMMTHAFDGPIAVARRRIDGIRLLNDRAPLDAIILDDAFQHRRLRRDLDLVVVAARHGFGNGWILPAGPLRESLRALRRADAVILISDEEQNDAVFSHAQRAALDSSPPLHARVRPSMLIHSSGGIWSECPLDLAGRKVIAVSGLASPAGFAAMIATLGAHMTKAFEFPDHHAYTAQDWNAIQSAAHDADCVVTTEKDLVKLEAFSPAGTSLYALRLEIVMKPTDEARLLDLAIGCIKAALSGTATTRPAAIASATGE